MQRAWLYAWAKRTDGAERFALFVFLVPPSWQPQSDKLIQLFSVVDGLRVLLVGVDTPDGATRHPFAVSGLVRALAEF